MKHVLTAFALTACLAMPALASDNSKTWPASEEAKQFVKETIVLGMLASPYGTGWTENKQLLDYFALARENGITGHEMTLAATSMTFDDLITQHYRFRSAMAEEPENYQMVNSVSDIEAAHLHGKTAVVWNVQTATVIDGDLRKMALLKDLGITSMILAYNDVFRTGSGGLAEFNGTVLGLTPWGEDVIDEMVRYGIMLDLSHTGYQTAMDAMEYMENTYPGVPFSYTHSVPAGLYKDEPDATPRGCYRNITDEEAIRAAKSGGYVSPTFTEWMMDGIWPDDISPKQAADMIDYYVKLVGVDHVGIATDDMFSEELIVAFASANADAYNDDGYMNRAFEKGATGTGELSKILAAITDDLWARGYTNEDLAKIYGGNKIRVWSQIWEGVSPAKFAEDLEKRRALRKELRAYFYSR